MTLEQALQYLEITSRVSCPQITCDQAREIAELMRDLSDQHQVDIAEMVSWKIHAQVLRERDEARAKLRDVERERRAEIDCGQPSVCAKPPGCQRHWAERAAELARDRDEALARLLHSQICVSGLQAQREESAQSTQIRINLIKIAQEQHMQAHSAIDKLGPFAEGPLTQRIGEVGAAMDSMRVVIETLRAQLREVERERDGLKEALDVDPNVEWQRRCLIAEKEQNEGWFQFANVSNELSDTRRDHEILRQIACGFAWDAGREMARLENPHDEADRNVQRAAQTWSKGRGVTVFVDPPEAAPDFDADDYAKPGKR